MKPAIMVVDDDEKTVDLIRLYLEKDGYRVLVAYDGEERSTSRVTGVQDDGLGNSAEHLPYVFERFYRVDQSRARTTGGAGLGLAIVNQLVESQGGQVGIDSQVNVGTRITFTSPIAGS